MWIVELALSKPHTFIVMAIAILLMGIVSLKQMAVDIFPVIDEPIVSCVWTYTGMPATSIEQMITSVTERAFTSSVKGISRVESMSLLGASVIKVYLHKGADIGAGVAQVSSTANAVIRSLPPGITPPFVVQSSATDVPVLQLVVSSPTMGEAQLFDLANQVIRSQFATVQGASIPFPSGGKWRLVAVDLIPEACNGYGVSANDVTQAINTGSIIAPSGVARMGSTEYIVSLNNMPGVINQLNNIPIKHVGSATVYIRDVATVHDGFQPQLNVVNLNGRRSVIMSILKSGDASTMTVVKKIKEILPRVRTIVPADVSVDILTDQSKFVQESIDEVFQETLTAMGLTAIFMLAILGSWRSTLIVATSIPLALLSSIGALFLTGNTINSMTLGGLALAVGMLVDDATVEIENVHRQMGMNKDIVTAILDGAREVALPTLVATTSICIVFLPTFLLTEPARSMFVPLGLGVGFAMMASYGLSRTIVPLMSKKLLGAEQKLHAESHGKKPGFFGLIHQKIDGGFNALRDFYHGALKVALKHRGPTVAIFACAYAAIFCLTPFVGRDFFPPIDAGQLRLHVNVPAGTRIEQTERCFRAVEDKIRTLILPEDLAFITDNIGPPVNAVNYAMSDSQTISPADGEILITLEEHRSRSTAFYQDKMRNMMRNEFPEFTSYFQPADIVTQIINAGLPAPIDVKVMGYNKKDNLEITSEILRQMHKVRGICDVTMHQVVNGPQYMYQVDRTKANQVGLTQRDISNSVLVNVSSSFQTAPNFWINPENGIQYYLSVMTPQYELTSLNDLQNIALSSPSTDKDKQQPTQLLSNVAIPERTFTAAVVNHLNVLPCFDVYGDCQSRDLGGVADDVQKIVNSLQKKLPRGTFTIIGGQVLTMNLAFIGLIAGIGGALVLVYLLLVVNFQSWVDPLIILMAIPGAMAGIVMALYVSHTTFSVPALMGAIMTIGVACANSILMVTFCNEQLHGGKTALESAKEAGFERFRPVCMTACAMILGMIPMSMSTGMNAPIGRAVIGGLSVATFSTLFLVPLIYSIVHRNKHQQKVATNEAK